MNAGSASSKPSKNPGPPDDGAGEVEAYLSDQIVPNAAMTYDRYAMFSSAPHIVWPWVVQLGKHRGGWYLKHRYECWLPSHWRATRKIDPRWQELKVGDRVPDYGGQQDYLEVAMIEAPYALVYRSERYGTTFSWALLLSSEASGTKLHLRFRGDVKSKGWRRKALITGGDLLDWLTTAPMLAGLSERAS